LDSRVNYQNNIKEKNMKSQIRAIKPDGSEGDVKMSTGGTLYSINTPRVWTAKGYGWSAIATSAVAALVVRPSTTAAVTLFNNTTKNFVIERAFSHNLVGVANSSYGIWVCVHPVGMTAPTNDITIRNSTSGLTAGTEGIFDVGATVVDNGWFPWGDAGHAVTVTVPGGQIEAKIDGRIVLPPTSAISLQVVADTTSATFCSGLHWYSVPITEFAVN
jgi:hypothetical protein